MCLTRFDTSWHAVENHYKYEVFCQINRSFAHAHSAHMLDSAVELHWSWSVFWHDPWTLASKHDAFLSQTSFCWNVIARARCTATVVFVSAHRCVPPCFNISFGMDWITLQIGVQASHSSVKHYFMICVLNNAWYVWHEVAYLWHWSPPFNASYFFD